MKTNECPDQHADRRRHQSVANRKITGKKEDGLMLPLRVVIDTNVLVSAALKPQSLQRTTLILTLTKPKRLYISAAIREEYAEVLLRRELSIR